MFAKCIKGPFRTNSGVKVDGDVFEITTDQIKELQVFVSAGMLSIHEKDPNKKAATTKTTLADAIIQKEETRVRKRARKPSRPKRTNKEN
jgi:hypothetical protein